MIGGNSLPTLANLAVLLLVIIRLFGMDTTGGSGGGGGGGGGGGITGGDTGGSIT